MSRTRHDSPAGVFFGIAAYVWWGIVAIYFKLVREVAPLEILAHRVIWSLAILLVLVTVTRRWPAIVHLFRSRRPLLYLGASTLLIAVNWFVFIWAITRNHMVDASLGYFMNPLFNVLVGFLFLGERLQKLEWVSVALAAVAVAWMTIIAGVFPWIAVTLAISFGLYGLVRKLAGVGSIEGLTIETALLFPLALGYLAYLAQQELLAFSNRSLSLDLLLLAAGPVTALPLLWFASAVRRLRLATVGLLQYISPSIQFALAVLVYREPLGGRLAAFVLIWTAIAIYTSANIRRSRTA